MNKLETLLHKIAHWAETETSIAAVVLSAVDTSQLPPKSAAVIVLASGAIRAIREIAANIGTATPTPVPAPQDTVHAVTVVK